METKFKPEDTVYLISSAYFIEEATVVMTISGFVTIRFTQRGGGTRMRENRFYAMREEAEAAVRKYPELFMRLSTAQKTVKSRRQLSD